MWPRRRCGLTGQLSRRPVGKCQAPLSPDDRVPSDGPLVDEPRPASRSRSSGHPAVAPPDQQPRGQARSASASSGPGSPSRRSMARAAGRRRRSGVEPVRSMTTGPGSSGPSAASRSAGSRGSSREADLGLGAPARPAQQDRAASRPRRPPSPCPSPGDGAPTTLSPRAQQRGLVEQRVLVEVDVVGQPRRPARRRRRAPGCTARRHRRGRGRSPGPSGGSRRAGTGTGGR